MLAIPLLLSIRIPLPSAYHVTAASWTPADNRFGAHRAAQCTYASRSCRGMQRSSALVSISLEMRVWHAEGGCGHQVCHHHSRRGSGEGIWTQRDVAQPQRDHQKHPERHSVPGTHCGQEYPPLCPWLEEAHRSWQVIVKAASWGSTPTRQYHVKQCATFDTAVALLLSSLRREANVCERSRHF